MIIIATPTRDTVTAGFAADLARLSRRHPDLKFLAALGIYIANLRNYCVNFAQQVGASHLLFVDSDMRFPEDALDRLLAAPRVHRGRECRATNRAAVVDGSPR